MGNFAHYGLFDTTIYICHRMRHVSPLRSVVLSCYQFGVNDKVLLDIVTYSFLSLHVLILLRLGPIIHALVTVIQVNVNIGNTLSRLSFQ